MTSVSTAAAWASVMASGPGSRRSSRTRRSSRRGGRRPSGHPDWEIEGWVTSYLAIAAGELAAVSDVVPTVTGHPARTVAEQLRAHPEDWAHLR